jgi:hypothetical protein
MLDQKPGLMQVFYRKDGTITSARIRHYIGTEAGKPKFSYCSQQISYAQAEVNKLGQKPFNESVSSKAVAIGETYSPDQTGQDKGQTETSSNSKTECGCSLAWFRTSACHVDDPGSNPGNRTIIQVLIHRDPNCFKLES